MVAEAAGEGSVVTGEQPYELPGASMRSVVAGPHLRGVPAEVADRRLGGLLAGVQLLARAAPRKASLIRLSPSMTAVRRLGIPRRRVIGVAARGSVGETIAPSAKATAHGRPSIAAWATTPTSAAVSMTLLPSRADAVAGPSRIDSASTTAQEADMAQTKAQRQAAAKKGAATRKGKAAGSSAKDAKSATRDTGGSITSAARAIGGTIKNAAGSVTQRAGAGSSRSKPKAKTKKR